MIANRRGQEERKKGIPSSRRHDFIVLSLSDIFHKYLSLSGITFGWENRFNIIFPILHQSSLDQEVYDYIDPNAEEGAVPEQGDVQIGPLLSYIKVA